MFLTDRKLSIKCVSRTQYDRGAMIPVVTTRDPAEVSLYEMFNNLETKFEHSDI